MHDTKIEEQLRSVLRAEADSVPLSLTAGELELRLRLRRSQRANQRMLLGAAAAVALAVGIGAAVLTINRNNNQSVATSPSPSAPVVTPSSTPEPTANPSAMVFRDLPTEEALIAAAQEGHPGFVVVAEAHEDGSLVEGSFAPGERSIHQVGFAPVTDHYVIAFACSGLGEFTWSIGDQNAPTRNAGSANGPCDPEATVSEVSDIHMETDVPVEVDTVTDPHASWRIVVLVAQTAVPDATGHEPSVPCQPSGARLPKVSLSVDGGNSTAGEVGTSAWKGTADDAAGDVIPQTVIHAKAGDQLQIRIADDVCASSWSINYGLDATGPGEPGTVRPVWYFVPQQQNGASDLAIAAENRFASVARAGDWIIHAGLGFPDGGGQYYWHVIVEP